MDTQTGASVGKNNDDGYHSQDGTLPTHLTSQCTLGSPVCLHADNTRCYIEQGGPGFHLSSADRMKFVKSSTMDVSGSSVSFTDVNYTVKVAAVSPTSRLSDAVSPVNSDPLCLSLCIISSLANGCNVTLTLTLCRSRIPRPSSWSTGRS